MVIIMVVIVKGVFIVFTVCAICFRYYARTTVDLCCCLLVLLCVCESVRVCKLCITQRKLAFAVCVYISIVCCCRRCLFVFFFFVAVVVVVVAVCRRRLLTPSSYPTLRLTSPTPLCVSQSHTQQNIHPLYLSLSLSLSNFLCVIYHARLCVSCNPSNACIIHVNITKNYRVQPAQVFIFHPPPKNLPPPSQSSSSVIILYVNAFFSYFVYTIFLNSLLHSLNWLS